ncbi:hypothetical protein D917_04713 [Trichinella nativa]|uniref:Uncharacterized protein n=1 Tax=Trichinella nativa TaxID=6335 RepID=A0A1Y3E8X6_9BILA|nr:hypothetical protein D917_04713 [Trichinella nativa]
MARTQHVLTTMMGLRHSKEFVTSNLKEWESYASRLMLYLEINNVSSSTEKRQQCELSAVLEVLYAESCQEIGRIDGVCRAKQKHSKPQTETDAISTMNAMVTEMR